MNQYDITGRALPVFNYRLPWGRRVRLLPPSAALYDRFSGVLSILLYDSTRTPDTIRVLYDSIYAILCSNIDDYAPDPAQLRRLIRYSSAKTLLTDYIGWISDILNEPQYQLPTAPVEPDPDDIPVRQKTPTLQARCVAAYSGVSIHEALQFNIIDYKILYRDAYVYRTANTKQGREFLEKAWCGEQAEPDRATLRAMFGGR